MFTYGRNIYKAYLATFLPLFQKPELPNSLETLDGNSSLLGRSRTHDNRYPVAPHISGHTGGGVLEGTACPT